MKNIKKKIAPIIIAAIFVLYYIGMCILFLFVPLEVVPKLLLIVIPALLCAVMISVAVSRIKEINSGEEDDLDKY